MSTQLKKWPVHILDRLDLVFPDAPHPAEGRSEVESIFPPPYYEWFQFTEGYEEYRNHHECLAFIEEYMVEHGPFEGLMGFSQGALLSAALAGLQSKALALKRVPSIKFVVLLSGAKFPPEDIIAKKAYKPPMTIPSLHFLGEMDFLMVEAFVDACVIHHQGHTIPRFACSHAGLVEEGLALFYSMKNEYGIEPGTDHYACIAMLLGRSRRLQEARIFIQNMPIKPAAIVWRSLLSACRLVDNLELGIYAAEMAILSDPKDSGTYVLISNIFASKGMWSEVGKVRKGRDDNRVMKEPGHSWLEIRGNTHIFLARDQSHQESGSIYFILDLLNLGIGREVLDLGTGSLFRYAVGCCVPS